MFFSGRIDLPTYSLKPKAQRECKYALPQLRNYCIERNVLVYEISDFENVFCEKINHEIEQLGHNGGGNVNKFTPSLHFYSLCVEGSLYRSSEEING